MEGIAIRMTPLGFKNLEDRAGQLKAEIKRFDESIDRAIARFGMHDEQYLDSVTQKMYVEQDLKRCLDALKRAEIVSKDKNSEVTTVEIGSTIQLVNHKVEYEFTIVEPLEANPLDGRVSVESPIGRSVIGKNTGEIVNVLLPSGEIKLKIISIC